jgi:hypothetical protein
MVYPGGRVKNITLQGIIIITPLYFFPYFTYLRIYIPLYMFTYRSGQKIFPPIKIHIDFYTFIEVTKKNPRNIALRVAKRQTP